MFGSNDLELKPRPTFLSSSSTTTKGLRLYNTMPKTDVFTWLRKKHLGSSIWPDTEISAGYPAKYAAGSFKTGARNPFLLVLENANLQCFGSANKFSCGSGSRIPKMSIWIWIRIQTPYLLFGSGCKGGKNYFKKPIPTNEFSTKFFKMTLKQH